MLLPSNSKYRAKVSRKSDSVTLLLLVFKRSLNKLAGKHKARPWRTGKHTDQVSGDLAETEFILSEAGTETKLAKAPWQPGAASSWGGCWSTTGAASGSVTAWGGLWGSHCIQGRLWHPPVCQHRQPHSHAFFPVSVTTAYNFFTYFSATEQMFSCNSQVKNFQLISQTYSEVNLNVNTASE